MKNFEFNWSITGSTSIEAETLDEAQKQFDAIPDADLFANRSDVVQHEVLVETAPGVYEEYEE